MCGRDSQALLLLLSLWQRQPGIVTATIAITSTTTIMIVIIIPVIIIISSR